MSANIKTALAIFGGLVIGLILLVLVAALSLGYWPQLGRKIGLGDAKDLGVTYTDSDFSSAVNKVTDALDEQAVNETFTEAELTALVNGCTQAVCVLDNAQVKTTEAGTIELAGTVNRNDVLLLLEQLSVPGDEASDIASLAKFLPAQPAIYIEATLTGTQADLNLNLQQATIAGFTFQGSDLTQISDEVNQALRDYLTTPEGARIQALEVKDDGIHIEADLQGLNAQVLE